MNTESKKKHNHWYTLLMCIIAIVVGAIIFTLLSAFGAFRYWQAEKTEQGETTLAFTRADLPFTHVADLVETEHSYHSTISFQRRRLTQLMARPALI